VSGLWMRSCGAEPGADLVLVVATGRLPMRCIDHSEQAPTLASVWPLGAVKQAVDSWLAFAGGGEDTPDLSTRSKCMLLSCFERSLKKESGQ
jgi:hypothetical protein